LFREERYTFDDRDGQKQERARALVSRALSTNEGIISFQVVQEFINVATRKFKVPLTAEDCGRYLDRVLAPLCEVLPSISLYHDAIDVHQRWQLSFYDALIVAAAPHGDCTVLYTEDLQHGMKIRSLTVTNPFL
jgi:predicted nucleic acid-binding protein